MIDKLYNRPGLEGRHPEGIPAYAVDRHTKRGKGGESTEYYCMGDDTTDSIRSAADHWKVDISNWTPAVIAKSHGPGRRFFKNQRIGEPTLITQFFKEGSSVHAESLVLKDEVQIDTLPLINFSAW